MELPIDQALQQGIAAHKEGRLKDAESLYRVILHSKPMHPHANHNLGLLAVAVNRAKAALPMFKTALEANPKIEQFWVSYVDALIKEKQLKTAKQVIEKARRQGIVSEKLNYLLLQIASVSKIGNADVSSPSPEQLNSLLECYQTKRYDDAEKSARSLCSKYPNDNFGWKILGAVLKKKGRALEAVGAGQKAVKIRPKDSEAHYNLGCTYKELNRLDDAAASFAEAIALKPEYAKAHFNLGNTFAALERFEEAEASYLQAVTLKPDDTHAHFNLGNTLQELNRGEEAVTVLRKAVELRPDFSEAHNNLGSMLKNLGKLSEAEASYRQAIAVKFDYAEAYNNLGITLHDMGKLEEAEVSYKKSIALKPELAEAHNNIGVALHDSGRLNEAKSSYTQALVLKPDYAEAYFNLGNTVKELGNFDKAEASYTKAIALKPGYFEAHNNLGNILKEVGRLEEAETSYRQAIALKPDFAEAYLNLSNNLSYANNLKEQTRVLENLLKIDSYFYGLRANVNLAICNFLKGDFTESKQQILAAEKIHAEILPDFKNEKVYQSYLLKLLEWHENQYTRFETSENSQVLYVLGESHSLVSHHLHIQCSGINFLCNARLIKGCKQWHLGSIFKNQFKTQFEGVFHSLPRNSVVLLVIGEIDCRLNSGIIAHENKYPEKKINDIILTTVENYLKYIVNSNQDRSHRIIIQGVPCPNIDIKRHEEKDIKKLVEVIALFNYQLKTLSKKSGFGFLDVYKLTNRGDGISNKIWHIDAIHLSPQGLREAWSNYAEYPSLDFCQQD